MDIDRFIEICVEEGYTENEARMLWSDRPLDVVLDEDRIRETCRDMLPEFERTRALASEEGVNATKLVMLKDEYRRRHGGKEHGDTYQQGGYPDG